MHRSVRALLAVVAAGGLCLAGSAAAVAQPAAAHQARTFQTATPIQHLVVIFQENVSFDHYFATYPHAANTGGPKFTAAPGTPSVNGLNNALLTHNPNENNPKRLSPSQALTCDQDHAYTAEQQASDGGLMDKYVQFTDNSTCTPPNYAAPGEVMDYYDGNTVTALWNYAQHFSMSDNFYDTEFGPSTPGALNLISGDTTGGTAFNPNGTVALTDPGVIGEPNATTGVGTVYGDADPFYDECSDSSGTTTNPMVGMSGRNVGDLLNAAGVSWGWFEGGFAPTGTTSSGNPVCGATRNNIGGEAVQSYIPHHDPFQYYPSTANPFHLPPANVAEVGNSGQANHNYDLDWFFKALKAGNMPAVSFLKAPAYEDGHAGYSDPTDEQHFLVRTINAIMQSPDWANTAIMITYDDSDGWYDHVAPPIINSSADPATDAYNGTGVCGNGTPLKGVEDRCGYGERLPFLLISPFARTNYVGHSIADQTSILRFIELNWLNGEHISPASFDHYSGSLMDMFNFSGTPSDSRVLLNPNTGEVVR
jgi:phospholipase C